MYGKTTLKPNLKVMTILLKPQDELILVSLILKGFEHKIYLLLGKC